MFLKWSLLLWDLSCRVLFLAGPSRAWGPLEDKEQPPLPGLSLREAPALGPASIPAVSLRKQYSCKRPAEAWSQIELDPGSSSFSYWLCGLNQPTSSSQTSVFHLRNGDDLCCRVTVRTNEAMNIKCLVQFLTQSEMQMMSYFASETGSLFPGVICCPDCGYSLGIGSRQIYIWIPALVYWHFFT